MIFFYLLNINVNVHIVYRTNQTGMFHSRFSMELHGSMTVYSPGIGNHANKTVDTVRRLFSTTKTINRFAFESPAFSYKYPNPLVLIDVTRCDRCRILIRKLRARRTKENIDCKYIKITQSYIKACKHDNV